MIKNDHQTNSTAPEQMTDRSVESQIIANEKLAANAMMEMAVQQGPEVYYEAADPGYKSAFTRDSLIAMSLRGDSQLLESQITYSINRLGVKQDPITGEEPGKAHHELPSVDVRDNLTSAYNACDTTAQLILGVVTLARLGNSGLLDNYKDTFDAAVNYVRRHVSSDGLFIEDPAFSGAEQTDGRERKYALKVTYWKDSELNRTGRREPNYPIVYSLAHFQNAAALSALGRVLADDTLVRQGQLMREAGLRHLWRGDHFVTAIDSDGEVDGPSSDSLMSLLYINPTDLPVDYPKLVETYMQQLVTEAGYRAGIPVAPDVDPYHMKVWTHEQALLNAAARLHGLNQAEEITRNIEPYLIPENDIFPELVDPSSYNIEGNRKQLWAIGAYFYFTNPERALLRFV